MQTQKPPTTSWRGWATLALLVIYHLPGYSFTWYGLNDWFSPFEFWVAAILWSMTLMDFFIWIRNYSAPKKFDTLFWAWFIAVMVNSFALYHGIDMYARTNYGTSGAPYLFLMLIALFFRLFAVAIFHQYGGKLFNWKK